MLLQLCSSTPGSGAVGRVVFPWVRIGCKMVSFATFPSFHFFALFCLNLSFPAVFYFDSAFAGVGLANNLAHLLLGSSFTAPSEELAFLLGILAMGLSCARCLLATALTEHLCKVGAAWPLLLLQNSSSLPF